MAGQQDREVRLVIKARNEAESALNELNKQLDDAAKNAKQASAETEKMGNTLSAITGRLDSFKNLTAAFDNLRKAGAALSAARQAVAGIGDSARTTKDALAGTVETLGKMKAQFAQFTSAQNAVKASQQAAAKAIADTRRELSQATREMNAYERSAKRAGTPVDNSGDTGALKTKIVSLKTELKTQTDAFNKAKEAGKSYAGLLRDIGSDITRLTAVEARYTATINRLNTEEREAAATVEALGTAYEAAAKKLGVMGESQEVIAERSELMVRNLKAQTALQATLAKYSDAQGGYTSPKQAAALQKQAAAVEVARSDYERLSKAVEDYSARLGKLGGASSRQIRELQNLSNAAKAAAANLRAEQEAFKNVGTEKLITNLRTLFKGFYGESRQAMSSLQRLRGEALSLITAWGGLYAILNQTGSVVAATQNLQAAQQRIEVVNGQNLRDAGNDMSWLSQQASRLGISMLTLADEYGKFAIAAKEANFASKSTREIFLSVAEAGRVNHNTTEQIQGIFLALTQMISKGKVASEELRRQLGDRLPGAFNVMARALNMTTAQLDKEMSLGNIIADEETLLKLAKELNKVYGSQLAESLTTLTTESGRLANTLFNNRLTVGRGGFINALRELLVKINEIADSKAANDALLSIGYTMGYMTEAVTKLVGSLDIAYAAAKLFVNIKLGGMLLSLLKDGGKIRAALESIIIGTALLKARWIEAGTAMARVRLIALSLGAALRAATGMIGVTAALYAIEALMSLWVRKQIDVTSALTESERLLNKLKAQVDGVKKSTEDWGKVIRENNKAALPEFEANFTELKNAYADLNVQFLGAERKFIGGYLVGVDTKEVAALRRLNAQFKAGKISATQFRAELMQLNEASTNDAFKATARSILTILTAMSEVETKMKETAAGAVLLGSKSKELNEITGGVAGAQDILSRSTEGVARQTRSAADEVQRYNDAMESLRAGVKTNDDIKKMWNERAQALRDFTTAAEAAALSTMSLEEKQRAQLDAYNAYQEKRADIDTRYAQTVIKQRTAASKATAAQYREIATEAARAAGVLGVKTEDILTVIGYESGFNPSALSPKGYAGLAQFSPANQKKYGINATSSVSKQIDAFIKYLQDIGFKPGRDGIKELYTAIQTGTLNHSERSDFRNGGSPGSVDDKMVSRRWQTNQALARSIIEENREAVDSTEKRVSAEKRATEATQTRLRDLREQIELEKEKSQGLTREAYIQKELNAARKENSGITRESLEELRKLKGEQYDITEATKAHENALNAVAKAQERIEKLVNKISNLEAARATASTKQEKSRLESRITTLTTELNTDAVPAAEKLIQTLSGADADAAIDKQEELAGRIKQLGASLNEVAGQMRAVFEQSVPDRATDAIANLVKNIVDGKDALKSFGAAFTDMTGQILTEMGKILVKAALVRAMSAFLGGGGGFLGGLFGFHSGGIVGAGGAIFQRPGFNPALFAMAARYHGGGIAGLKPDEVPAILRTGEEVLTSDDPRHRLNGGLGQSAQPAAPNITIKNVVDAGSFVSEGLRERAGTNEVIQVISKNKSKLRTVLGIK